MTTKILNRVNRLSVLSAMAGLALMNSAAAQTAVGGGGLAKARGIAETLQAELTTIVPIVAALVLLIMGVGYAARFVEKDTFARWGIGIIIAGSAAQITAMMFT